MMAVRILETETVLVLLSENGELWYSEVCHFLWMGTLNIEVNWESFVG
jgi:hypothetical protein